MNNKDQLTEATINSLNEFYDMFDEDMEYEFVEKVTQKIQKVFPDAEVFEEPSSQGGIGSDYFTITIDEEDYIYEFDISEEEDMLYSEGPAKTATYYAKQIISDLKSKLGNNKKVESTEELSTKYCIKYFYNDKFIGYLNSFGEGRGHIWIRIYAGSDEKYIRKFNTERGAKISMNGPYAQNANELLVNGDEAPIHLYSNSILKNKEEGIDFNLLKSEIITLDNISGSPDLSELKSIEDKYNA